MFAGRACCLEERFLYQTKEIWARIGILHLGHEFEIPHIIKHNEVIAPESLFGQAACGFFKCMGMKRTNCFKCLSSLNEATTEFLVEMAQEGRFAASWSGFDGADGHGLCHRHERCE